METERFQVQNIIIMAVMVEIIEKIMVVVEVVGGCGDDDQRKNYPKAPKGREPKQKKNNSYYNELERISEKRVGK